MIKLGGILPLLAALSAQIAALAVAKVTAFGAVVTVAGLALKKATAKGC